MAIKNNHIKRPIPSHGKREMTIEEFKQWMMHFDKDGDGRISKGELREAFHGSGGWFTKWRSERAVRAADTDRNGFVDDNEINNLVDFAQKRLGVKIILQLNY
uniref:EF-hand domain-containing protein n=1 Tax=Nelumbo nucifera TaxID=4432 RepID=A0A822ZE09_NELNU|nr:TPA_asm: hypothetical protein HUJ06_015569 [Nelumbo nucifera]